MKIEPTELGYLITGSRVSGRFNTASLSQSDYADLMEHCRKEIVEEFTDEDIKKRAFRPHAKFTTKGFEEGAKWLRDQISKQQ